MTLLTGALQGLERALQSELKFELNERQRREDRHWKQLAHDRGLSQDARTRRTQSEHNTTQRREPRTPATDCGRETGYRSRSGSASIGTVGFRKPASRRLLRKP